MANITKEDFSIKSLEREIAANKAVIAESKDPGQIKRCKARLERIQIILAAKKSGILMVI